MNNLENKEILSDEIFNAIVLIVKEIPDAVFGGSIALNAIGLINRPISDIDLFFSRSTSLTQNGYLSNLHTGTIEEITSETVTDINGVDIQRTGAKIAGVKTCCFKVSDERLQCSKHKITREGNELTICIQNVNYAIEAKKTYSSRNPKHKPDLETIYNELNSIFLGE
jgi:hypothetical protein